MFKREAYRADSGKWEFRKQIKALWLHFCEFIPLESIPRTELREVKTVRKGGDTMSKKLWAEIQKRKFYISLCRKISISIWFLWLCHIDSVNYHELTFLMRVYLYPAREPVSLNCGSVTEWELNKAVVTYVYISNLFGGRIQGIPCHFLMEKSLLHWAAAVNTTPLKEGRVEYLRKKTNKPGFGMISSGYESWSLNLCWLWSNQLLS